MANKEESYNKILNIVKSQPDTEFTIMCAYNKIQEIILEQQRDKTYKLRDALVSGDDE